MMAKDPAYPPSQGALSPRARRELAEAIAGYRGQEIFFGGRLDEGGAVESVTLLARGNRHMVPVIFEAAKEYPVVIHNHPSSYLEPSDADLEIASSLGNHGIGFYIVSNGGDEVNVVVPHRPSPQLAPIDEEAIADFFSPAGELSRKLPGFESRPSQVSMLRHVVKAFNGDRVLLCEAPTGTGKSLGYMVPAVHWARTNGEKVILSTHTIALQEQLILRDLPRLHDLLGGKFTYALAKGRNHYLCLRKFGEFVSEPTLFDDEAAGQVESILEWGRSTKTGDRAELDFVPPGGVWDRLASESDTCRPSRCPNADRCFVQQARRRIFAADLIVVNHHVLCADAAIKHRTDRFDAQALLPPWTRLVIDEAHNLEDTATDHFGRSYSSLSVVRTMNQLIRSGRGGRGQAGLLHLMGHRLRTGHTRLSGQECGTALGLLDEVEKARSRYLDESPLFHQNLYDFLANREGGDFGEKKFRIYHGLMGDPGVVGEFRPNLTAILDRLQQVVTRLEKIHRLLLDERDDEIWEQHLYELGAYQGRLTEAAGVLEALLDPSPDADEGVVRWVSATRFSRGAIMVNAALTPLAVGPSLRDALFEPATTVVLSSATLADHRGFGFLRRRLGLEGGEGLFREVDEISLPPVFDYRSQCVGFIPSDLPQPQDRDFPGAAAGRVLEAARYFHGRTLVLFTSYTTLSQMRENLREPLTKQGIRLLCQGEAPRHQLLEEFRGGTPTVLLGVSSFWEGVDVPGDALSCLVMVKLPFAVPSEPVSQARSEALEREGKSAFAEFSLPVAVLRFRQGFGRLIRTASDRGLFLMLDRRLLDKPYGRDFLKALPPMRLFKGTELSEAAENLFPPQK